MHDMLKLTSTFLDSVFLIMALVLMVSLLQRVSRTLLNRSGVMGAVFSFGVVMTMSDPIDLDYGGVFDMRGLLIGTCAALFGPVAGLMALATGVAMRLGIGGPGLLPGFVGIACAFGGGLYWRFSVNRRGFATWQKSMILGVFITVQLIGVFFAPVAFWPVLFMELIPYTLATNILGALLINHLISGELSFLSEAETSKVNATTDHLTGLLNRRGLDLIYPSLAHLKGPPKGRALMYFDIDRFKDVNDTFGHAVGDAAIKLVANEISRALRPSDVFARIGGDEFVVVLNQIGPQEAEQIATRCREVVQNTDFVNNGKVLDLSVSVGAIWMLKHTDIDHILDQADKALYTAKVTGRNKVVFKSWPGAAGILGPAVPA